MLEFLKKWFLVREIKSKTGVVHFRRWRLLQLKNCAIYIHQIFRSDEDAHLHNHPFNYVNLLLSGGYYEDNLMSPSKILLPGMFGVKDRSEFHRITLLKPTISLVFAFGNRTSWGYSVDGKFVDNDIYRTMKRNGKFNRENM